VWWRGRHITAVRLFQPGLVLGLAALDEFARCVQRPDLL